MTNEELKIYENRVALLRSKYRNWCEHETTILGSLKEHKNNIVTGIARINDYIKNEKIPTSTIFFALDKVEQYFTVVNKSRNT